MSLRPGSALRRSVACLALIVAAGSSPSHESTIDHVDRVLAMWVQDGALYLSYRRQVTERVALFELNLADADRDGTVDDEELRAQLAAQAQRLEGRLQLELAGQLVPLRTWGEVVLDPALGQTFIFRAELPAEHAGLVGRLSDESVREYPGETRYQQSPALPAGAQALAADWDDPAAAEHHAHHHELGHEHEHPAGHEHPHADGHEHHDHHHEAGAEHHHEAQHQHPQAGDHPLVIRLRFILPH